MLEDDGQPKVGPSAKLLGVRVPPDPNPDILIDKLGYVAPGGGGMSVGESVRALPNHRIPRRLRNKIVGAAGSNDYACWRMSEGDFVNSILIEGLVLVVDSGGHGLVEPDQKMLATAYQETLESTRNQWVKDE